MKVGCAPVLLAVALTTAVGCQGNVTTLFPAGLEPLEDNPVPDATGEPTETLREQTRNDAYVHVYGRGFIFATPAGVWQAAHDPDAMVARCSTTEQHVTMAEDPAYEYMFSVHYVVRTILTVEWDDEWRYGVIEGMPDAPRLGMIKHQKTQGSGFINLSEGTVQIVTTDDPQVTEIAFVEHLDAISGSTSDVVTGMRDNYARLLASVHGTPEPGCP